MFNEDDKKYVFLPHSFKQNLRIGEPKDNYFYLGSNFFANIEDARKLIEIFSKSTSKKNLNIYGSVSDKLDNVLDNRINLMGFQENLDECFMSNKVMIAPIKQNYGMNVKIAEALHHGKIVLTNSLGMYTVSTSLDKIEKKMLFEYKSESHLVEILNQDIANTRSTSNVSTFKHYNDNKIIQMFKI